MGIMASAHGSVSSRWECTLAGMLSVNLAFTLLLNGGYGPKYEGVTALMNAALLGVYAASVILARSALRLHPAGWLPLPFVAYAAIHAVWLTPAPWLAQRDLMLWVQMAVVFWVVLNGLPSRAPRRLVFHTLVAVALIGVVTGCYQVFVEPGWRLAGSARPGEQAGRATGSFGLANSFAGLLLLLIPAVGARVLRPATATTRVWWMWVGLVLLAGLVFTLSRGAWLALAIALTAAPLLALRLAWSRRAWAVVSMLVLLGAAGWMVGRWVPGASERVAQFVTDGGERTRPFMWAGAWRLWLDAPVAGNGAGSYNLLFERHRAEGFRDEPLWAHNEYLNLLADYGLLGAILAAGAAGVALAGGWRARTAAGAGAWPAGGLGLGLLAFALQLSFEFHLKIPGLVLAAATVAALALARVWSAPPADYSRSRAGWPLVAAASLAFGGWFFFERPRTVAETLRMPAREALDGLAALPPGDSAYARVLPRAREALAEATRTHPANAQAWADLSYACALMAFLEPERTGELGREAEAAADAALRRCAIAGEFWARRGEARDLQGRWAEAGADFARAVGLSPADPVMWYRYGAHLARRPAGRESAEAALRFCLRLDPWFSGALRLLERLQRPTRP